LGKILLASCILGVIVPSLFIILSTIQLPFSDGLFQENLPPATVWRSWSLYQRSFIFVI
jgi:hypothetical protein